MQSIERGIFYEENFLGVTLGALVFSHGTIMIDAPLRADDARSWRSTLLNQRGGMNRLLINLDSHPDRTLGARAMDCTIVAHQRTAQIFRNRPTIFKGHSVETGAAWESYQDAIGMRWASPDITFSDRMSLHWGGPEIVLESHPGPASGAIWVIIPSARVAFIGDSVVNHQPPFLESAEIDLWLESLDLLLSDYKDYTLVTGRGGMAHPDSIRTLQQHLNNVADGIDRLGRRNLTPDSTEELIPGLLTDFTFSADKTEAYTRRLRYGLYQYFARRFRPTSTLDHEHANEDGEQTFQ